MTALFYTFVFFALTWPAVLRFRTHWFADEGDGLQNVWNIWWIKYAITVLHRSPWHTEYLHYPYGTSLVAHTLNPFNGLIAIAPSFMLSPVTVHNAIVTGAFVAAGVTAFLLAFHLTRAWWPSLAAGFIFTFSSFHFEHAEGHLQLVSLEWIPLFVLAWLRLLDAPTIRRGVGAALVLLLVILCDYYYFLYCVMTGFIMLCWWAIRTRTTASLLEPRRIRALAAFAIAAVATSGILAATLVWTSLHDRLTGRHEAADFSMDLLAPVIYGGHWRFGSLTRAYWIRLPANYHESSVYLGLSVIGLLLYVWRGRRRVGDPAIGLFFSLMMLFLVLALGPTLQIAGKPVPGNLHVLPYAWLELLFPPLTISGVPIRMMVMVMLCAAVLAAFGFTLLLNGGRTRAALAIAALLVFEYLPKTIPTLSMPTPAYVNVLKDLPGHDGVLDDVSDESAMLFYQTIHQKPLALGYVARVPRSVAAQDNRVRELVRLERFDRLWSEYRLRYVVSRDRERTLRRWRGARTIWDGGDVVIVDVSGLQAEDRARLPALQRVAGVDDERAAGDEGVVVERGMIGADDRAIGP